MNINVERLFSDNDSTIGVMSVDGSFKYFTCEDEFRVDKVMHETRIPAGRYQIKLREEGGMIKKYRARYGYWHRGMLHLQDVPGFEYIYIHAGNTDDHTSGCILVGYGANAKRGSAMNISHSRDAYSILAQLVHEAIDRNEDVFITITDRDRD